MTIVYSEAHNDEIAREGNRVLTFFGILLSNVGSFGITLFWVMGAIHLWQTNGGQINLLGLEGLSLVLFWALPLVVVVSLAAWLLYLAKLDLPALALAAAPIGLTVLYYLWLVLLRHP
ncbi:MAG TPA: hypothetical protein VF168_02670 [Trueperaceae bacterium]